MLENVAPNNTKMSYEKYLKIRSLTILTLQVERLPLNCQTGSPFALEPCLESLPGVFVSYQ
jgi:hypothetical protein